MKKNKDIIFALGFIGLVIAGLIILVRFGGNNSSEAASLSNVAPIAKWTKGNSDSKVILVEYSDFQCPACGAYYPLVKQLTEEFGDRIKFTYRHFPLSQIHKNAAPAARAAEASGKQGKFWEMHDLLFENQSRWSESSDVHAVFESYAQRLDLNIDQFKSDMKSKEIMEKVESDYQSGVASRVNGTPTFFLNGKKFDNPRSYEQFKTIITEALDAKI